MANNTLRNADGSVSIIIRPRPENIPLPYELRETVAADKWDFRIVQINKLCAQYSKPLFERIWFVFAFLACLIVPAALNHVIFDAITPKALRDAFDRDTGRSTESASNRFDGTSEDQIIKYIVETRWITFGIFVGLILVLWTPFVLWKRLGTMRARALTTRWAVEDGQAGAAFIPRWTIRTPGISNINGAVTITTPPTAAPTLFNPQAYLPPYILQAGQQASGMMWAQQQPTQIPYNAYGPPTGVPPGFAGPGAIPAYYPGAAGANITNDEKLREDPFADEKHAQEFENVKV